jgi:hypothetical protein
VYVKYTRSSGVGVTLASLQILLAMPLDVRLNNIEFQHAQRSGVPDEQNFHRRSGLHGGPFGTCTGR